MYILESPAKIEEKPQLFLLEWGFLPLFVKDLNE
jgi:hypothetical protein